MKKLLSVLVMCLPAITSQGMILYGYGNNDAVITSDPLLGFPWDSVAKVSDGVGNGIRGSAVHLGGGYMITADHVNLNSHVTFNGSTFYSRDTSFLPVQIGTADIKIFRLTTVPSVGSANLYTGTDSNGLTGYHVGWGQGRNATALNSSVVGWGGGGTEAKRWGTNSVRFIQEYSYTFGKNYTQESLITRVGSNQGATEASLTIYDSGSGFFQNYGGQWYLTGVAYTVSQTNSGSSTFAPETGGPFNGDNNFLTAISHYSGDILAVIPEPSQFALLMGLGCLFSVVTLRRRQVKI